MTPRCELKMSNENTLHKCGKTEIENIRQN